MGFKIICDGCGKSITVTNDYKRDEPIDVYTMHDDGYTGCKRIEITIDCQCGQTVEFRTF